MSARFESIWNAIENTPALADKEGLSQSRAAKLFGVTQPRISDLVRGKIDLFSIDTLVNMLTAAGMHVELRVADAA
jgi:predicted XRE-type DNA-binding protein